MKKHLFSLAAVVIAIVAVSFTTTKASKFTPQWFVYDEVVASNPIAQPSGTVNGYPQDYTEGLNQRNYRAVDVNCPGSSFLCEILAEPTTITVSGTNYTVPVINTDAPLVLDIKAAIDNSTDGSLVNLKN